MTSRLPSAMERSAATRGSAEVRLSELTDGAVDVAWHEAVAVVRQLATQALSDPAAAPHITSTWIDVAGAVRVGPGAGGRAPGVPALADVLAALLPTSSPPELLALTTPARTHGATPEKFIEALSFFARPDDDAAIGGLASRALSERHVLARADALKALTERSRYTEMPATPDAAPTPKRLTSRALTVAGLVITAASVLAVGNLALTGRTAGSGASAQVLPHAAAVVAQRVQKGMASASSFVSGAMGAAATPRGRGADVELPAPVRGQGSPARRAVTAVPRSVATEMPMAPMPPAAGSAPPGKALPALEEVQHALAAAPHGNYSAAARDVVPPALLRSQMPEQPTTGLPGERRGVLDLVIGADGEVVSARLTSESSRHQDRMMVSAAKAWRFRPASRNGEAVGYRLLMPITW